MHLHLHLHDGFFFFVFFVLLFIHTALTLFLVPFVCWYLYDGSIPINQSNKQ